MRRRPPALRRCSLMTWRRCWRWRRRRARPGLAQIWAVTGALDGGGGSCAWWWWWWMVVVVGGKMERSQRVTSVTYQPRLLDLATRGRLLLINSNYH
jgi:hypothetical protein